MAVDFPKAENVVFTDSEHKIKVEIKHFCTNYLLSMWSLHNDLAKTIRPIAVGFYSLGFSMEIKPRDGLLITRTTKARFGKRGLLPHLLCLFTKKQRVYLYKSYTAEV